MGKHHLIIGETTDFITGKTVVDTHDERERRKIAKFLVNGKGFSKSDITSNVQLPLSVDGDSDTVSIDFVIRLRDRAVMIVKFGPGSIVSRQRPLIAAARLLESYIIPYAVISNGQDAIIMEANSGKVIGKGFDAILSKKEVEAEMEHMNFDKLLPDRTDKEKRILFCMEVLSNRDCECD
ncbi:MAG: type I restriction enzyme HsdR N-terminal domain-containing protein [Deltaproteobacteria bacterium]|nr:type I restriction enzyme HsdR N-terminal domain-containing protein [Deltaproteobacteria bacterium]